MKQIAKLLPSVCTSFLLFLLILGGGGPALGDSELLEAVSEAIWHVSLLPNHVAAVKDLTAVPILVALLHHNDEKV